jgi:hypothetical protein
VNHPASRRHWRTTAGCGNSPAISESHGHNGAMDETRDLFALCRADLIARLDTGSASSQECPRETDLGRALQGAQQWAEGFLGRELSPQRVSVGSVANYDDADNLRVSAYSRPVISVQAFSFGASGTALTTVDPSAVRFDDGYHLVVPHAVRFLPGQADRTRPVADYEYIAGWVTTALDAAGRVGDRRVVVEDISALVPGRQYRLRTDSGIEEAVTVRSAWTPPVWAGRPVPGVVPLSTPLENAHAGGTVLTDLPPAVCQAVAAYAAALLRAWAVVQALEEAEPYPDTALNPDTRFVDPRDAAPLLAAEAERFLVPFRG